MTKARTNFLGIPIDGDIVRPRRIAQRPLEELQPLLLAVLQDEYIVEFGWTQYTPYFNDGDPCVFGVGSPWIRSVDDEDDADVGDLEGVNSHPTLGIQQWTGRQYAERADVSAEARGRFQRCKALEQAIESGAFNDVLLDAFGDHADVTVRRAGIQVNFYQHE